MSLSAFFLNTGLGPRTTLLREFPSWTGGVVGGGTTGAQIVSVNHTYVACCRCV